MKKFTVLLFLFFVFIIIGILLYLFLQTRAQVDKLNQDNISISKQLDDANASANLPIEFSDIGMGTGLNYPKSWKLLMNVVISLEDPSNNQYSVILAKDTTKITFKKIIGGVGDVPELLDPSLKSYEIINKGFNIVRYSDKNSSTYYYVKETDCNDVPDSSNLKADSVCIGHFFTDFGKRTYATVVKLELSDPSLLKEADDIVISASQFFLDSTI